MHHQDARDVAIVGGGIAGLAAGVRLAREGLSVTVFEGAGSAGGRARSQEKHGMVLNLGPHALYPGTEAELADLGITVQGGRPAVGGVAVLNGRRYLLPAGPGSILRTGLFGPRQKIRAGLAFKAVLGTDPATLEGRTLGDWMDEIGGTGRVRDLLRTYFRLGTYANAPDIQDAATSLRQFQDGAGGVLYVDSGWGSIVERLREALLAAGGELCTGDHVEHVRRETGGLQLGFRDGRTVAAASVVIATSPGAAARLLADQAPASTLSELQAAIPAKAAVLDVGVTKLPRPRDTFALGIDRPLYFQVHSLYADLAPPGTQLMSVARYIPAGEEASAEASRAEIETLLDVLQPGWREVRVAERFLPSVTVMEAIPLAGRQRTAVDGSGLPGVYFAGDWAGDEGMLAHTSLASARHAAALASERIRERAPWAAAV